VNLINKIQIDQKQTDHTIDMAHAYWNENSYPE